MLRVVGICLITFASSAFGHHEAAVTIAQLTEQIEKTPTLTELYYQRGQEYISVDQLEKAKADFSKALSLRADYLPAARMLAQATFQLNQPDQALTQLRAAMTAAPAEHQFIMPSCHHLEGQILLKMDKPKEALVAFQEALKVPFPEIDTLRLRAEAQRRLGLTDQSIADLKAAWLKSNAIILRNEWLEALLAAGRADEALPVIEQELASSRFRSSWLIRRARAFLVNKHEKEAKEDLDAAIKELTDRLVVTPPPFSLLCDRALAYALSGQIEPAREDLKQARTLGAPEGACRLASEILSQKTPANSPEKQILKIDRP